MRRYAKGIGVFSVVTVLTVGLVGVIPGTAQAAQAAYNGRIAYWNWDGSSSPYLIKSLKPKLGSLDAKTTVANDPDNGWGFSYPTYSPDGTKLAYIQTTSPSVIFVANADGSNATSLDFQLNFSGLTWTPDGKNLLVGGQVNGHINFFKVPIDNSEETQLTNYNYSVYNADYSPDGSKIVYYSRSNDDIYVMNSDGTNPVNLTSGTAGVLQNAPSWSPDGTKIIYVKSVSSNTVIGVMNSDGTNKATIPAAGSVTSNAIFSPDGTKIAYATSNTDLHIMNIDGSNDAVYAHDATNNLTWQPLTLTPTSSNPNLKVTLSNGKAVADVASLYSDPYGEGIDKTSVTVTSSPASGSVVVNASTGVITYTPTVVTVGSGFMHTIGALLFPRVSAAATSDSFGYRVCSTAGPCSTGTVTVNLIGAPSTGAGAPPSTLSAVAILGLIGLSMASLVIGIRRYFAVR